MCIIPISRLNLVLDRFGFVAEEKIDQSMELQKKDLHKLSCDSSLSYSSCLRNEHRAAAATLVSRAVKPIFSSSNSTDRHRASEETGTAALRTGTGDKRVLHRQRICLDFMK